MIEVLAAAGSSSGLTPTDPIGVNRIGRGAALWPGLEALRVEVTLHEDPEGGLAAVMREAQLVENRGLHELGTHPRRWLNGASAVTRATRATVNLLRTESGTWFGRETRGASAPYAAFEWTVHYNPLTGKTDVTLWTMEDESQLNPARQRGRATTIRLPPMRASTVGQPL
jgi:hypothetical protein